jgi:ubiquitin-conjugating enzyme E2 variant
VAADLFTGFVHFLADNFGRLDTAFGRALVVRFREHHDDPDDILRDDVYDLFGPTLIFAIPTLILSVVALNGPALWFALCFVITSSFANPIHKWAHMEDPGPVISWLQRRKIIMPPAQHDYHHLQANTHYCTVAGWFDGWFLRRDVPYRLRELLTRAGMRRS